MRRLKEALLEEKEYLLKLDAAVRKRIENVPSGRIRIVQHGNTEQYYYKTKENKAKFPQGEYIKKKDIQIVNDIVQRDYDLKVLQIIKEQLNQLEALSALYEKDKIVEIYEQLNGYRKKFVEPWVLSDDEYRRKWCAVEFTGKPFEEGLAVILTNRGERVRSKSEKIIADMLEQKKVPYRYECPLNIKGFGIVYPDFTILNIKNRKEIYWEHFGMMDNKEYVENALRKIEGYQRNGILLGDRLIITYETTRYPVETGAIERNIRNYCACADGI